MSGQVESDSRGFLLSLGFLTSRPPQAAYQGRVPHSIQESPLLVLLPAHCVYWARSLMSLNSATPIW